MVLESDHGSLLSGAKGIWLSGANAGNNGVLNGVGVAAEDEGGRLVDGTGKVGSGGVILGADLVIGEGGEVSRGTGGFGGEVTCEIGDFGNVGVGGGKVILGGNGASGGNFFDGCG